MFRIAMLFAVAAGCLTAAGLVAQPPGAAMPKGTPNAQMQAVLDAHASLDPKPIETLTPAEARKQPTVADAVKAL